ncbi:MAG: hypothetical protein WC365_01740 [Candidatus Babeliales bacterium]
MRHISLSATLIITISTYAAHANLTTRSVPHYEDANFLVSRDNDLCKLERSALKQRYPIAHETLEKFLGEKLEPQAVPTIGISCSGGGVRAAIAMLGLLRGLDRINLLNAVTYCSTLSGSTWTTASWFIHNMPLPKLTEYLKEKTSHTFDSAYVDEVAIIQALSNKKKKGRILSTTDIWGGLVADSFLSTFKEPGQYYLLTDLQQQSLNGSFPIPIFTAVIGETDPRYEWVEMTPFSVGSTFLSAWINPHALGRKFAKGASFDQDQEESLSYVLGAASSAYALSGLDIVKAISKKLDIDCCFSIITELCGACCSNTRFTKPEIYNFVYGINGCPLSDLKKITLVDAGFAFFHPLPPLLRRHTAIYIICDVAKAKEGIGKSLARAATYAQDHKYPFPPINYAELGKYPLSVFADPKNKDCPVVIYIPNLSEFPTLKFAYSSAEFDQIMGGIENAVIDNSKLIENALRIKIKQLITK